MKIALSAETTVDLPKDLLEKYDIHTIPFSVILGEETRFDGDLVPQDIFDYVEKTGILPKTSAVNVKEFAHYFAELLKTYDAIIHVSLSSEISCAYANGVEASKKYKNVIVIDSRSLSTGIALPLLYGRKLIDEGKDLEDVVDGIKARIP